MPPAEKSRASPPGKSIEDALVEFQRSKSKAGESSGNHVRNVTRVVEKFAAYADTYHNVTTVEQIDAELLKDWIQQRIKQRIRAGSISSKTGRQYINYLSAFLTYCEKWEWIDSNPCKQQRVKDEYPDESTASDTPTQQTWGERERESLRMYVDRRAHQAIDEKGMDAVEEVRDRAVVYLLMYTGARVGELVADTNDPRRRGIFWDDVNFDGKTIKVLGKSQDWENVQFPEVAHPALERHRKLQDPPTGQWPVFPTTHEPTLREFVSRRTAVSADEIDEPMEVILEQELTPPSIPTEAVRRILKRLSAADEVVVEGDHEYLKPHGARRGLGKELFTSADAEIAQKALRHADPKTTSEMYADVEAGEVADVTDDVFEN